MERACMKFGAVIAAAVAASLCGGALAQNVQSGAPADSQPQSAPPQDVLPQDVPPQFEPPQPPPAENTPAQTAPSQNTPAQPAQSQSPQNEAVSAMIGAWEFSNADHDKICHFNFRADAFGSAYKLDVDKNCPSLFPSTKDMVAWNVDNYGGLRLLNYTGGVVVELSEVEGGMFDGFTPEEGRYILQTAAAAPVLSADAVAGDWAVSHGRGKPPVCVITLANSPAAADASTLNLALNLTLTVKPGCDPTIMRFGPSAWRMDQGALVLLSARGLTWQFEQNDANTWQRVPESADPILLVRQ
jgi:Protease inhibitor Inh